MNQLFILVIKVINVQCHHLTNLCPCHWLPQQTHAYCCICKKPGPKLVVIPTESRTAVFVERNILIPPGNRCCPVHFDNGAILSDAIQQIPTTEYMYALCQVWLSWNQWLWRRWLFKVFSVFALFHNYLPFEKSVVLHLNKLQSPSPKDSLC